MKLTHIFFVAMFTFAACAGEENPTEFNIQDAHRAFTNYFQQVKEKLAKGEFKQPETPPPDKGEVFVEGFGWTRPDTIDFFLTLKPIELRRDKGIIFLILTTAEWVGRDEAALPKRLVMPKWCATMQKEKGEWVVPSVRVYGRMLSLEPDVPTNKPNQTMTR